MLKRKKKIFEKELKNNSSEEFKRLATAAALKTKKVFLNKIDILGNFLLFI